MAPMIIFFITLGMALVLFIWDRIRYDLVALLSLFVLVVAGIVPSEQAFSGFGHPAVITVAAVFVISRSLQYSGVVDLIGQKLGEASQRMVIQIALLSGIVCLASAFMNNIAALAILMPVALHLARKAGKSPSYYLMPIAFASILGGTMTLIGTPPNIIIATFRADITGEAFGMFDFTPIGLSLSMAAVAFIVLVGWRWIPKRTAQDKDEVLFQVKNYVTELKIPESSKLKGISIREINNLAGTNVVVLSIIRQNQSLQVPDVEEQVRGGDILLVEADTDDLKLLVDKAGIELAGNKEIGAQGMEPHEINTLEAVVMNGSPLAGKTAISIGLRSEYNINLLAVARHEKQIWQQIGEHRFQEGDLLLLQGSSSGMRQFINNMRCLPLASRGLQLGKPRKIIYALSIFILAIASVVAGLLQVHIAFSVAAVVMLLSGLLPLKDMYTSIDWPVIILLGAMIPVGVAFESSGGAGYVSHQLLRLGGEVPAWFFLGLIMGITMLLSNVVNNAAAVILMAPVGIQVAAATGLSIDPFLMAIAIGGSCAFLTPIGHQSNTVVMGPGGYKFGDYWKMGLPVSIIVVLVSIPVILHFWPPAA